MKMQTIRKVHLVAGLVMLIVCGMLALWWIFLLAKTKVNVRFNRNDVFIPRSFAGSVEWSVPRIYVYSLRPEEADHISCMIQEIGKSAENVRDYRPLGQYIFDAIFLPRPQRVANVVTMEAGHGCIRISQGTYAVSSSPNINNDDWGLAIWSIPPGCAEITVPAVQWYLPSRVDPNKKVTDD